MMTITNKTPLTKTSLYALMLLLLVPFLIPHHLEPLATFYSEYVAIGLGLATLLVLLHASSWQAFKYPRIASMPIAFAILIAIQWACGMQVYWQQHLTVIFYLLWAALLIVVASELKRIYTLEGLIPKLALSLLVGGVISSALVLMQVLNLDNFSWIFPHTGATYSANIAQVNQLANYLALGLGSLMYLYATGWIQKRISVFIALVLLTAIAMTGARMGWLYVFVIALSFVWVSKRSGTQSWQSKPKEAIYLVVAFALIQIILPLIAHFFASDSHAAQVLPQMPAERVVEGVKGHSVRWEFIKEAWHMFTANPWLGVGWGQFGWHDFTLAQSYPNHTGWTHHSHNILAQVLAECGIFGGLILLLDGSYWFKQFFKQKMSPETWWILALVSILLVHSMLEYPLWYAYFLGIFAILLGLGDDNSQNKAVKIETGPLLVGLVLVFSLITFVSAGTQYRKLECWYQKGLHGLMHKEEVVSMLNQMSHMRKTSLVAPQMDMVLVRALPDHSTYLASKLRNNQQVMQYRPGDQEVYTHAYLLALSGKGKEATQQLKNALIRYPSGKRAFFMRVYPRIAGGDLAMIPLIEALSTKRTKEGIPIISMPGFRPNANQ